MCVTFFGFIGLLELVDNTLCNRSF